MADLGNIESFIKTESVNNLDWFDVDESSYREEDTLPKQNLDVAPDLQHLWGLSATPFVANTGAVSKPVEQLSVSTKEASESLVVKATRLLVMQTDDLTKVGSSLRSRFDAETLQSSKTALSGVLAERGLLGRLYVNASDFPNCHNTGGADFVRRYAAEAPFVLAKPECQDCKHKHADVLGNQHCGVFNKQIQIEIPYTDALALDIESKRLAHGVVLDVDTGALPKDRIRKAFLATPDSTKKAFTGLEQQPQKELPNVNTAQGLVAVGRLTQQKNASEQAKIAQAEARPVVALIQRELLKGRSEKDVAHSLKLSFDLGLLEKTRQEWEPHFREAGLFGSVYTTQQAFADCKEGADFLARHASKVRAVVAGSKCEGCQFKHGSFCSLYGRKLVASAEELYTSDVLSAVVTEHKIAGTLPYYADKVDWGSDVRKAFKNVFRTASTSHETKAPRALIEQAFTGHSSVKTTSYLVKRDIVKVASQYMNEGLYGADLLEALQRRFSSSALIDSTAELRPVLAEQGLQGIHFIDPSVYDDYGSGCKTAASQHRSRSAVKYAKIGDKCASCVHHTRPGFCSTLKKELVQEPPYVDKYAEQQAILSSGKSTEVSYESLMNNGLTMLQEYQMQHEAGDLELNPQVESSMTINFGNQKLTL